MKRLTPRRWHPGGQSYFQGRGMVFWRVLPSREEHPVQLWPLETSHDLLRLHPVSIEGS